MTDLTSAQLLTIARLAKHNFWMAGDPACPEELKAPNGELHTLQCKACGEADRAPFCVPVIERELAERDAHLTASNGYAIELQRMGDTLKAAEARAEGLARDLELILPIAKGYAPRGQSSSSIRICREYIENAEAALAAYQAEKGES